MLKSVARLGAKLSFSFRELCKIGALRALRRASPPKAGKSPKAGKIAEGGKNRRRRKKPPKAGKIAEGGKNRRRREIVRNGFPRAQILSLGVFFHGEFEFDIEKG